jgi:hypothetical protein
MRQKNLHWHRDTVSVSERRADQSFGSMNSNGLVV